MVVGVQVSEGAGHRDSLREGYIYDCSSGGILAWHVVTDGSDSRSGGDRLRRCAGWEAKRVARARSTQDGRAALRWLAEWKTASGAGAYTHVRQPFLWRRRALY